ncbi:magnesium transporter NIPA2 [Vespula pensylvanica]|uniref:Magnesium transporter NIPA2 n=1 Tax=Vespula pensylvanica TaxID=30213 RepID=A0A834UEP1_VESPE|nr:magnesium transporter NIPA2 [Vespula pensylvanica]KAF7435234.1 hypothetical protein H0235_003425 [Vespula pensylvanica]
MFTSTEIVVKAPDDSTDFYIGLGLAISSSIFIGASFIIKKIALIRLQRYGGLRASSGGFGYLKEWIWWAGLISMGIGEAENFTAYAFAPASLITPLGALSVLVSTILASKYLNEKLNLLGKIGCFLCILGSTIIILHSPKEEEVNSLDDLLEKIKAPGFLSYVLFVILCTLLIIFYFGPAYGKQNVIVYIFLCSSIGSLTVMSCKGIGLALKETMSLFGAFSNLLTWIFFFSVIFCVTLQMNYLNKSLDLFDTTIVMPIYYVCFTTLVIIASAILFREWQNMKIEDIVGSLCGFFTIIIAIFLLNAFKLIDINYNNIRHILRPKRELIVSLNSHSNIRDTERLISRNSNIDLSYGAPDISRTI